MPALSPVETIMVLVPWGLSLLFWVAVPALVAYFGLRLSGRMRALEEELVRLSSRVETLAATLGNRRGAASGPGDPDDGGHPI